MGPLRMTYLFDNSNTSVSYLTQLAGPEPKGTLATARVSGTCYRNFEIRWRPVLPRLGFGGLKVP